MKIRSGGFRRLGAKSAIAASLAVVMIAIAPGIGAAAPGRAPSGKTAVVKTTGVATAPAAGGGAQSADSSMTLRAGQSGTEFRSMTVEGEDRVHVDFGRPDLTLDLDPEDVPGLTRGTAMDVLDRTVPDLSTPMITLSSQERSPYLGRPWLRQFATGSVARFRPAVKGVVRWRLLVADSRGETVASFDGTGDPPKEIAWDGRTKAGAPVTPGLTYSYVFEAHDRAGNKRNFVGQGFNVSAYRVENAAGQLLVMSGRDLTATDAVGTGYGPGKGASGEPSPIYLEVASWLNQSPKVHDPVRVAVGARTMDQASMLGSRAVTALSGRVIGDPGRIQMVTEIAQDAPEDGVLRIGPAK